MTARETPIRLARLALEQRQARAQGSRCGACGHELPHGPPASCPYCGAELARLMADVTVLVRRGLAPR